MNPPRLQEVEEVGAEVVNLASPGKRLRSAREAKAMDIPFVATQLRLSNAAVEALESEDFEGLPARVFIRGYYRNYARLVDVPETLILREFSNLCPDGECKGNLQSTARLRSQLHPGHGIMKLVTWLILLALIGMVGYWGKDYLDRKALAVFVSDTSTASSESQSSGLPPLPAEQPGEPVGNIDEKSEVAASSEPEQPAVVEATTLPEPSPAVSEPAAVAQSPADIELRFTKECWVDVRDATRKFKLSATMQAGDHRKLEGKPPYSIVFGNLDAVQVLVNGKAIDLKPYTKGDSKTVKFQLDPENLPD